MFFILQPILVILLHCIFTHSTLLPFSLPSRDNRKASSNQVQTLRRRYLASSGWVLVFLVGAYLVNDAHQLFPDLVVDGYQWGMKGFYLGWILIWISPVVGWLTYLGGDMGKGEWKAFIVGAGWLCAVDT